MANPRRTGATVEFGARRLNDEDESPKVPPNTLKHRSITSPKSIRLDLAKERNHSGHRVVIGGYTVS